METVLLLDFQNFAWKGVVDFKNAKDHSYVVVFNFMRNIKNLIEQFYPSKIFLCGEGGKTFRHDLYSDYKANRIIKTAESRSQKTLQTFYAQIDIIWEVVKHLPLHRVFASGFEADDVIATLATDLKDEDTIIVSNDSDYTQLLQKGDAKNLSIFNPFTREYIDAPVYHYLTYKICVGDTADNIPGLIQPKKALALAVDPKALAVFIASSEETKENYLLNKALIELNAISLDKLTFLPYTVNYDELRKAFDKMGFKSILKDYDSFTNAFASLH
jgi:DNA polymerase-1